MTTSGVDRLAGNETGNDGRARVSTPADLDAIVATMTSAFFDDPLWGPAFPDPELRAEQASAFWRLFVTSAQRYPWLLVADAPALPTTAPPTPASPTVASPTPA
ncbi:MAG: hypothetical protein M3Y42_07165, partial [Actinomycetota bacterium]|nr:hypothetical protein [Actinomycetota bacterium]